MNSIEKTQKSFEHGWERGIEQANNILEKAQELERFGVDVYELLEEECRKKSMEKFGNKKQKKQISKELKKWIGVE